MHFNKKMDKKNTYENALKIIALGIPLLIYDGKPINPLKEAN